MAGSAAGRANRVRRGLSASTCPRKCWRGPAPQLRQTPAINYVRADLESLELPEAGFDLAYSSLALHYVEALASLFSTVHRAFVAGGHLIFSVEHPTVYGAVAAGLGRRCTGPPNLAC